VSPGLQRPARDHFPGRPDSELRTCLSSRRCALPSGNLVFARARLTGKAATYPHRIPGRPPLDGRVETLSLEIELGCDKRNRVSGTHTPGVGERLILEENAFVERVLPGSTVRQLTDEEMAVYRGPFPTPQSRRPTLRLPNELPIAGEPADVDAALRQAHAALRASRYPKLLFAGDPGALVSPTLAEQFAGELHHCRLVKLGAGRQYLQEDHPDAIGRAIADWISELEAPARRAKSELTASARAR
jgi:hypothetical protein